MHQDIGASPGPTSGATTPIIARRTARKNEQQVATRETDTLDAWTPIRSRHSERSICSNLDYLSSPDP